MGRELKSCPYACLNQMKIIKMVRPRGKKFLNPGIRFTAKLIKNECRVRLAKQRSMIKSRELNLLIKPRTCGKKLNSKDLNGSFTNKRELNYPFTPVNLHILSKKSRGRIKLASHKKEIKPSIPVRPNILSNKNVLSPLSRISLVF